MKRILAALLSTVAFLGCSVIATSASAADIFDIDSQAKADIFDIDSKGNIFDIDSKATIFDID